METVKKGRQLLNEAVADLVQKNVVDKIAEIDGVKDALRSIIKELGEPALKAYLWNVIRQTAETKLRECQNMEQSTRDYCARATDNFTREAAL